MKFYSPTSVYFGPGEAGRLAEIISRELGVSRLFLVTDKGIREAGIAERVINQFPEITVFDEIEPNPRHTTVNRAGEQAREMKPEAVIGLGGGSALDAAKAVALLATNPGPVEDYEGREKYKAPPLPVVAIPTTCGTGSEATWVSVITHTGRRFKMSIKGPLLFPKTAVVDPDLLRTLPAHLVASTGLDALTHAVEAYTVRPATAITDIFVREAIRLIFRSLEPACADIRGNHEAREMIMMGSLLAGFAFGNSDVGAVHCLAESVGALYDIPHGVANAVFLPFVMEFNLPACAERYAEIARLAGLDVQDAGQGARGLIQRVKSLSQTLNIPSLRDLKIPAEDFPEIALKSFQNNSNPSNPREAAAEDYLNILAAALKAS